MLLRLWLQWQRVVQEVTDVNELTKQVIAESVAEEYESLGITSDPNSLYKQGSGLQKVIDYIVRKKKCLQLGVGIKELKEKL